MKEDKSDPVVSAIIFQLILTLLSGLVAVVTGFRFPPPSLWPYFLLSGSLYAIGTYCGFKAIKTIEASEMAILSGCGSIMTIVIAFFILGERLTPLQIAGAALILLAVIIVKFERKHFRVTPGMMFAILSTSLYGTAVVFDGYILKGFDVFSFLPTMSIIPAIVLVILFPKKVPLLFSEVRRTNRDLAIYSALYVLAAETYYIPLTYGALVSQMGILLRVSIILTVVLAAIFLHERSHVGKKLAGAILTTIGVFLIK